MTFALSLVLLHTSDPEHAVISVTSCIALLTLVRALIVSKVDYCNSVLAGIPGQLQDRLQSVLNAAARLVSQQAAEAV